MLFMFGLCIFMIAQELKASPDAEFEIVSPSSMKNGDVGRLVDSSKGEDKAFEKADLAGNLAQNSKGEVGHAVMEAPKGGMVNEGPIVGTDEGLVIDGRAKKSPPAPIKADRGSKKANAPSTADDEQDLLKLLDVSKNARVPGGIPKVQADRDGAKDEILKILHATDEDGYDSTT